jgi:hypothetical protein
MPVFLDLEDRLHVDGYLTGGFALPPFGPPPAFAKIIRRRSALSYVRVRTPLGLDDFHLSRDALLLYDVSSASWRYIGYDWTTD